MNIDQRLERLTERHEALVQYIELSAHENRENFAKTQTQINAMVVQLDRVVATISELATIAESHERRVTHLEDKSE